MKYRMYKLGYNISLPCLMNPTPVCFSLPLCSSSALQVNFLWEEVLLSHKFYFHMVLFQLASTQHDFSDPEPSLSSVTCSIFVFNRLAFQGENWWAQLIPWIGSSVPSQSSPVAVGEGADYMAETCLSRGCGAGGSFKKKMGTEIRWRRQHF